VVAAAGVASVGQPCNCEFRRSVVRLAGGKALSEDLVNICFHGNDGLAQRDSSLCIVTARHGGRDASQTILESMLSGKRSFCISIGQIVAGWNYVEKVKKAGAKVKVYPDGSDPSLI